jgi:hypothetical protein
MNPLDFVPKTVLAAGVLAFGALSVWLGFQASAAKLQAANARETLQAERTAHSTALAKQIGLVLKTTNELDRLRMQQEKRDGDAQATIAALGEDLRRRSRGAGGPGLRDPFATACRGEPAARPGPAADAGGDDAAEAGGLLSAELEGLLLRLHHEADAINNAYASCRQDALNYRAKARELQQLSPPSHGSASTVSP